MQARSRRALRRRRGKGQLGLFEPGDLPAQHLGDEHRQDGVAAVQHEPHHLLLMARRGKHYHREVPDDMRDTP